MIMIKKGNAASNIDTVKPDVVIHCHNCQNRWTEQKSLELKAAVPELVETDNIYSSAVSQKLGSFSVATVKTGKKEVVYLNAYTRLKDKSLAWSEDLENLSTVLTKLSSILMGKTVCVTVPTGINIKDLQRLLEVKLPSNFIIILA